MVFLTKSSVDYDFCDKNGPVRSVLGAEFIEFRLRLHFFPLILAPAPALFCHFKLYFNSSTYHKENVSMVAVIRWQPLH